MIKDILLPITGTVGDHQALSTAVDLARRHGAHLSVMVTVVLPIPVGFEWEAIPADLYSRLHEAERGKGARQAAEVRAALAREGLEAEVRVVETQLLPAARVVAVHARYADVVVLAAPGLGQPRDVFLELLFGAGRPLLVVPDGGRATPRSGHVVIAWQPTREAARAVHDALPLLAAAKSVDVVVVDPQVGEQGHGELPGADISAHLARHGLRVTTVQRPHAGEDTARCILRHVVESGAECLVAGAYGHSRLREFVLGGVTRQLLAECPVPMLLSH